MFQTLDRRAPVNVGSDGLGITLTAKRTGDNTAEGERAQLSLAMAMRTRTV